MRQPPGERLLPEQHVRDAVALAAGQPGRDQRVDLAELVVEHLRPAGHDQHHALGDRGADLVDGRGVAGSSVSDFGSSCCGVQKLHVGPPTSPKPSAYGVSPTTTTPTSRAGGRGRAVLAERDRARGRPCGCPRGSVVPGMTSSPETPCHATVQPPAWLPMSSALRPATYTFASCVSGSTSPVVPQQHLGLGHGLAGDRAVRAPTRSGPMFGRRRERAARTDPSCELLGQDPPVRVVDPRPC